MQRVSRVSCHSLRWTACSPIDLRECVFHCSSRQRKAAFSMSNQRTNCRCLCSTIVEKSAFGGKYKIISFKIDLRAGISSIFTHSPVDICPSIYSTQLHVSQHRWFLLDVIQTADECLEHRTLERFLVRVSTTPEQTTTQD
jgi:hypothetical protein